MKCSHKECPGIGRYLPVFLLRASPKSPSLAGTLHQLTQCEGHKLQAKLEDFLSKEGWDKIEKHLREAGKGHFQRKLTRLDWRDAPPSTLAPNELPF